MRNIKFRGKVLGEPKWVYGDLVRTAVSKLQIPNPALGLPRSDYVLFTEQGTFLIKPLTIGQFTGLLDKNGKAIYEGDILTQDTYIWKDRGNLNYVGVVEWVYSQWQVIAYCVDPAKQGISNGVNYGLNYDGFFDGEKTAWEKLGNVHDHPGLLEGSVEA